ncbi:DHH family phosphoesterase [Bilophila wadsworthia]|uniref:DHH family phosphoesterase n=1 Tax=Bilophila wadsworthia TaxID=35833 RepID=UPI0024316F0B|nr:DHH family phosphoesterase [Bilophila wadsworthia]
MKPSLASAPTVITCHSNADWDALSSMIGMSMIYPDSIMIFPGSMEKPLNQFFNETAVFLYTFKNIKEIDHASVKRVVVVDTQIRSRVPQVQDLLDLPGVEVEVWDHHPTLLRRKEQGHQCRRDAHRDHGLHLHAYLPSLAGTGHHPGLSGSHFSRARHLRRHGRVHLHVHQSRKISSRGHGCASTAWICPSSLISSRRA